MKGVVSVISRPEGVIVASIACPRTSVKNAPIAVSVTVDLTDEEPRRPKWICVEVAVGITVAPPMEDPPKYASALELIFLNVAWTL